jgi:hypothetical protein
MAKETFQVTLTDDQLKAAKDAAARAGVNLSESGSQSRDGVTISYKVEPSGTGSNVITVDVLYRPFYVPAEAVQTAITNFLTNPPPPADEQAPPVEPPPGGVKAQTSAAKPASDSDAEHHKAGGLGKR